MPDQTPQRPPSKRCPDCGRIVGELQQKCICGRNLRPDALDFLRSLLGQRQQQQPQQPQQQPQQPPTPAAIMCPICGYGPFGTYKQLQEHRRSGQCDAYQKTAEGRKNIRKQKQEQLKEQPGAKEKVQDYFLNKGITRDTLSPQGMKKAVTGKLTDVGLKGLDKYGGIAVSQVKNNLKFAIYFPLAVLSVFRLLIPTVEGYTGTAITPAFIEPFLLWNTLPVILAGLFGVALPPSIILGKSGVSFDFLNKICLFSIAGSAAIWGGNNVLLPAVKAFMPEEYALMMCMMKYKGNMQICVAQNQTVQYQKTGSYETLDMELGAVTPSQTIPPANPMPDTWDLEPYDFMFTLSNKNVVGSLYDITIDDINVSASPYEDGRDSGPNIKTYNDMINAPNYPIQPGGSVVVTTRFDELFYPLVNGNRIANCKQYTYFTINVSTKQIGGGSAKFGLIDNDEGVDNQNFMYFFNPDIKTESGPIDVYTYTLPFVIPVNRMRSTGRPTDFGIYIKIENKGEGIATIENLTLVQASETQDSLKLLTACRPSDTSINFSFPTDCSGNQGKCILIEGITPIQKKKSVTIRCDGDTGDKPFFGKTTDLISVNANYKYLQTFNEQIACNKDEGLINTFCFSLNQTECSTGGSVCHWCSECNGQRTPQANHVNCTSYTDCGYHCVKSVCGAECGSKSDCPPDHPYCTQDCRCWYSII